jgi:hypothetical protein
MAHSFRSPKEIASGLVEECCRNKGPFSQGDGCRQAASEVFTAIYKCVGIEEAWRIFSEFKPPGRVKLKYINGEIALLHYYDLVRQPLACMTSAVAGASGKSKRPGVRTIAKAIAAENKLRARAKKRLPKWERGLCNGSTNVDTIATYINRALKKRRAAEHALRRRDRDPVARGY